jgi:hypothetical protein
MESNLKNYCSIYVSGIRKSIKTLSQDRSSSSDLKVEPPKYERVLAICTKPEININMEWIHDILLVIQVLVVTIHHQSCNEVEQAGTHLLANFKELVVISADGQILIIHTTDINSIKICTTLVQTLIISIKTTELLLKIDNLV